MSKAIEGSPESQMRARIIGMMLDRRSALYTEKMKLPRDPKFNATANDIDLRIDEIDELIHRAGRIEIEKSESE